MGYTVEASGVLAVIFLTIMILISQVFRIRAEVVQNFGLHERVERSRHSIEQSMDPMIRMEESGKNWSLEISARVFRPEESLRAWSLVEENE